MWLAPVSSTRRVISLAKEGNPRFAPSFLRRTPWRDGPIQQPAVVLLAGVLHDPVVEPEGPGFGDCPWPRIGLRIVQCEGVLGVAEVDALEGLDDPRLIAHRMTDGVHAHVAVQILGFDDQRVTLPMTD